MFHFLSLFSFPQNVTPLPIQPYIVGHLPVLRPGQCFEYMSGTDLVTTRGMMSGKFYMARVPPGTPSAKTGDHVQALQRDNNKFQVNIATFPLVV
jgi:uncharacterized protein affecting Mg2+/Co2+ transport